MSKKKDSFKPWLRRPAVNRSVTIPVTGPLTQPLTGFGGAFDPLALNPYAFFDGESYKGTLENPTLDLDPATPSTLDVITATRSGTTATYTDASGNIATASADTVRVDYTQGEQLTPTKYQRVGYTDFSNTSYPLGWQSSGTTLVEGAGYLGQPSRIFTAESQHQYVACGVPTTAGVTYTGSIWVRRISGNETLVVQHSSSATGTNSSSLSVTTEWTKVEVQFLGNASNGNIFFGIKVASSNAAGTSFEISQPQVEEGTTASSFVANTTGSPKFITGATYGPRVPMILVEPSATNLARFTDFSDGWNTLGSFPVTSETGEGYAGQSSVILTANANSGRFRQGLAGDVAGVTYTASIWIRRVSGSGSIRFEHNSSPTGGVSSHLNITEEWSRVEAQFEGNCFAWGIQIDTSGDSVEIAMPQVEQGTVATSFIPAGGAGATRAADDLEISGSSFTGFYNDTEGTFYLEGVPQNLTDNAIYWMDTSPSNERIAIYDTVAGDAVMFVEGTASSSAPYYPPNQLARLAISVKSNAQELSINGGTSVTLTKSSLPSPTSLHIGSRYSSSDYFNGRIRRLLFWPYHSENL